VDNRKFVIYSSPVFIGAGAVAGSADGLFCDPTTMLCRPERIVMADEPTGPRHASLNHRPKRNWAPNIPRHDGISRTNRGHRTAAQRVIDRRSSGFPILFEAILYRVPEPPASASRLERDHGYHSQLLAAF
jgi:hypothetical protein